MPLGKAVAVLSVILIVSPSFLLADVLTTNGGFESADFTGWQTAGGALVVNSSFGITPTQGTYQAFIVSGTRGRTDYPNPGYPNFGGGDVDAFPDLLVPSPLESFFGLPAYSLYPAFANSGCGFNGYCVPIEGSGIKQSFTANAGDALSFDFSYVTNDPGEDFAFVDIDGTINILATGRSGLAGCAAYPFVQFIGSPSSPTGFEYDCSSQQFVATLTTTGTHTVGVGVVDTNISSYNSGLLVDNFQLSPVPEPATWLLLASGLVGIVILRKRQTANLARIKT